MTSENALLVTETAALRDTRATLEDQVRTLEKRGEATRELYLSQVAQADRVRQTVDARREAFLDQVATSEVLARSRPPEEYPVPIGPPPADVTYMLGENGALRKRVETLQVELKKATAEATVQRERADSLHVETKQAKQIAANHAAKNQSRLVGAVRRLDYLAEADAEKGRKLAQREKYINRLEGELIRAHRSIEVLSKQIRKMNSTSQPTEGLSGGDDGRDGGTGGKGTVTRTTPEESRPLTPHGKGVDRNSWTTSLPSDVARLVSGGSEHNVSSIDSAREFGSRRSHVLSSPSYAYVDPNLYLTRTSLHRDHDVDDMTEDLVSRAIAGRVEARRAQQESTIGTIEAGANVLPPSPAGRAREATALLMKSIDVTAVGADTDADADADADATNRLATVTGSGGGFFPRPLQTSVTVTTTTDLLSPETTRPRGAAGGFAAPSPRPVASSPSPQPRARGSAPRTLPIPRRALDEGAEGRREDRGRAPPGEAPPSSSPSPSASTSSPTSSGEEMGRGMKGAMKSMSLSTAVAVARGGEGSGEGDVDSPSLARLHDLERRTGDTLEQLESRLQALLDQSRGVGVVTKKE